MARPGRAKIVWAIVGALAVWAVVVTGLVGLGTMAATAVSLASSGTGTPRNVDAAGGVVVARGSGGQQAQVRVFLDFGCQPCADFDRSQGAELADAVASTGASLSYVPVAFTDVANEGYATRAANAAYCVADGGGGEVYLRFQGLLFSWAKEDALSGRSDQELADAALEAGAPSSVRECVTRGSFERYGKRARAAALATTKRVPRVLVDGEPVDYGDGPVDWAAIISAGGDDGGDGGDPDSLSAAGRA